MQRHSPDAKLFGDLVQIRCVGSFGSGLLVRPGVVLTALHCVADPADNRWLPRENLQVFLWRDLAGLDRHKGREQKYIASIAWPPTLSAGLPDIAVLTLEGAELPEPFVLRDFTDLPIHEFNASILGFPKLAKEGLIPGGRGELHLAGKAFYSQATNRKILFNAYSSLTNIEGAKGDDVGFRDSWAGLSGGPLLLGSTVLGVIREVPMYWDRTRVLEAEPLDGPLRDPQNADLRRLLCLNDFHPFVVANAPQRDGEINISVFLAGLTHSFRHDLRDYCSAYLGTSSARKAFGGRDEQLNDLVKWLRCSGAKSSCIVLGPAGIGKSTLVLQAILAFRDSIAVAFVPISIRFGTNSEAAFYAILAGRLIDICGLDLPLLEGDKYQMNREQCLELLERIANEGPDIVIVVDGLDEAVGWELDSRIFHPREHVRFLVAARPEMGVSGPAASWIEKLEWSLRSVEIMQLGTLDIAGVEAVLQSAKLCASEEQPSAVLIEEIFRVTKGDPLLLGYYVEDLRCQLLADSKAAIESLRIAEEGFPSYFRTWLRRQKPIWEIDTQEFPHSLETLLAIFTCALGPLRFHDLECLMATMHGEMGISMQRIHRLSRFVMEGPDGFVLNHPRLAIHLSEELFRSGKLLARCAEAILGWCLGVSADLNEGRLLPELAPRYALKFMPQHLQLSCARARSYMCIAGAGWLQAWVAQEGWYGSYASQLQLARREIAARAAPEDPLRAWILRCELILSSIRRLGDAPPALILACVEKGVLSKKEAFSRLEFLPAGIKVPAVAELLRGLNERERSWRLEECMSLLPKISSSSERARAICSLLPWIWDRETQKSLQLDLIDLLNDAGNMASWLELIEIIMPGLTTEFRCVLIEHGLNILSEQGKWDALLPLVEYLTSDEAQQVYARVKMLTPLGPNSDGKDLAGFPLVAFLPRLTPLQQSCLWQRALKYAEEKHGDWDRTTAYCAAWAHMPEQLQISLTEHLLAAARSADGTLHGRIYCTSMVAKILPIKGRRELMPELINGALSDLGQFSFSRLSPIVELLEDEDIANVLNKVLTVQNRECRHNALGDLAPVLDSNQLRSAIAACTEYRDSLAISLSDLALSVHLTKDVAEDRMRQLSLCAEQIDQPLASIIGKYLFPKVPPRMWPRLYSKIEDLLTLLDDQLLEEVLREYVTTFPEQASNLFSWAAEIESDERYAHALSGIAAKLTRSDALLAWQNLQRIQPHVDRSWLDVVLRAATILAKHLPPTEAAEAAAFAAKRYNQLYPRAYAEIVCQLSASGIIPQSEAWTLIRKSLQRSLTGKEPRLLNDYQFFGALIPIMTGPEKDLLLSEAIEVLSSHRKYRELAYLLPGLNAEEQTRVLKAIHSLLHQSAAIATEILASEKLIDPSLKRKLFEMLPDWASEISRNDLICCITQLADQLAELEGVEGIEIVASSLKDLAKIFP